MVLTANVSQGEIYGWGSYRGWSRDRLDHRPCLCCPMRVLWRDYLAYCKDWGFSSVSAGDFVRWLRDEEDVEIRQGGRGRLRRVVLGVGLQCMRDT